MADKPYHVDPDKEYDGIIFEDEHVAQAVAPLVREDVNVLSQDARNDTKLHLHDNESGQILTQVNIGAMTNWEKLIDLR